MNNTTLPCSDDRLHLLLDSHEGSAEFNDAAAHLEACANCQTRLVDLAADRDEWHKARRSLLVNESDASFERERSDRSWTVGCHEPPPKTWDDAMFRQLLMPPSHPEMLGRLGRYEIERLIGSGGMGVVFKGFDSELNRPVAIKVLAPHLAGSGAARIRFAREARAAAAIVHEHVVAIHNVSSDSEPPFLVMQYVAGESLQARLDRQGPLNVCEVLRIAGQTATALAAAHKQGLVHRDVKPSNIMLEQGVDRTLLTDFGLARASDDASLTHSGHIPGTPHYMSPEQACGENADQRSDLFSLGSVMYAMCTGRLPFRAESSYGVLRRITDSQPRPIQEVNAQIPLWLCCVIARLHAKSVDDRYTSAEIVADMLGQCLAHVQQPNVQRLPESVTILAENASRKSYWQSVLVFAKHRRRLLIGTTCAGVLLAAFLIIQAFPNGDQSAVQSDAVSGSAGTPDHSAELQATSAGQLVLPPNVVETTDWNATEVQIRQLTVGGHDLTSRIDRLWDDTSTPILSVNQLGQPLAEKPHDQDPAQ